MFVIQKDGLPAARQGKSPTGLLNKTPEYAPGKDRFSPKAQHLETNREEESTPVSSTACTERGNDIDAHDSILSWLRGKKSVSQISDRFCCEER